MLPLLPIFAGLLTPVAQARPEAPALLCAVYPDAPTCAAGVARCVSCHSLAGPPAHNAYGLDLVAARDGALPFAEDLPRALAAIEGLDSDGDGVSNLDELLVGTEPGFDSTVEAECAAQTDFDNASYLVGKYDPAFAWRRVMLDFCGRSPRYDEVIAFRASDNPVGAVRDTLSACLESPYWDAVLEELAIGVIEPTGPATDFNILGNWAWDLRLYAYAMSGDRDAAEVMTATYLVVEEPAGSGRLVEIPDPRTEGEAYAQPLAAQDRFGVLTTRFSLAMRVMFADVPRTLAAHWYKRLLGLDIARSEGLYPIDELDGELPWPASLDVDDKGVWQEGCAACHSTLDGLSYPWVRYNGIDLEGDTTATYLPERAADLLPTDGGWIFGRPVRGPEAWVAEAVASDAFARQTTRVFWRQAFHRDPYSCEEAAFDRLWTTFRDQGRNVESLLAELVLLDAYGTP